MEWRVCVQNKNYEVSDIGQVRRVRDGRLLKLKNERGYRRVKLFIGGEKLFFAHVLVCTAFHGPAPADKPLACHDNDMPSDNRADNLYWGDRADNMRDAHRNLRIAKGENQPRAKLTMHKAAMIRRYRLHYELSEYQLAKQFEISRPVVHQILKGELWAYSEAGYDGRDLTEVVPKQLPLNTKLTAEDKSEIRSLYRPNVWGHTKMLALRYGVCTDLIRRVVK